MTEYDKSTKKTGSYRKRSIATHNKQQWIDYLDADTGVPQTINGNLIRDVPVSSRFFYEDVGDNYEKLEDKASVPYSRLPYNVKEKFEEDFKKLDEKLIERKKRSNLCTQNDPTVPLRVDLSYSVMLFF